MTPRTRTLSAAAAFAAVLLVAACSAGTTPAQPSAPAPPTSASPNADPAGPTISIAGMKFTSPASVPPGAKITVTNADSAEHSVTADTGNAFDVDVDGKGTATFTAPSQPGTYAYHCTYHPMMHGQLIVQ